VFARLALLRGWRADVAALGLGVLAAAALPPVCAVPVLLVAMPGLLALIGGARGPGALGPRALGPGAAGPDALGFGAAEPGVPGPGAPGWGAPGWSMTGLATAARRGWWFGFGLNLLGLYWITEAILVEAARFWWLVPLAVPALAAVMAVFIAVPAALAHLARPGWRQVFTLAGGWVLADLARQFIATGFPWNPLGSVWEMPGVPGDVMIQPAAWIGAPGLTFLTVLLSALPALGWRWRATGVVVLAGWAAIGFARIHPPLTPQPGAAPTVKVVLVQGNVAQGQKWDRALVMRIFDRYLSLTRDGIARAGSGPTVVVWPETASPFFLQTDAAARAAIAEAAGGGTALVGAVRFDQEDRPRNSLFAVLADGGLDGIYDKWHLVPFGEYQPSWFPAPFQVVPGGGFQPGPGPRTLHLPGYVAGSDLGQSAGPVPGPVVPLPEVGPLICYEAIFPGQVVDEADRPGWMVNITNDAWFGNSTGPRQHLAAARLRAVEEGLPLMRAANTGISAAFDPRGHEITRLGMNESGVLVVDLPPALPATLFARFGLWIPTLLALVALEFGLILSGGVVFRTRRSKN
jgi:apolipoprotein N-acyltransferase